MKYYLPKKKNDIMSFCRKMDGTRYHPFMKNKLD
jgi:hypothetical protein